MVLVTDSHIKLLKMKAISNRIYGSPKEVLELINASKPQPKENELLIKIKATTINDYDWSIARGKPYIYRLLFGLFKPKNLIPGMELAGVVEAIGSKVQGFQIGDEVFGDISDYGFGTFAEYIAINEKAVIHKPKSLSFEEAAAIPHAGLLAWQGLLNYGKITKQQKVLINGGGGGVGTLGLQIAKMYDCHVTGVDATSKLNIMKDLGYDHVIDYKQTDFTKNGEKYDLILDCKTKRSVFSFLKSLSPTGRYITIGGDLNKILGVVVWGTIISLFSLKKLALLPLKPNEGLKKVTELFLQGKLKCQIDGPHPLEDIPKLVQYFGDGEHKGKIVVSIY
jgi:NADPH:quinone reductase-like Zn-dependent oxidoreductase